ncbi:hypothetical protein GF412_00120 [Candidatus Micrarchaeota archaeon]|nr:hypothetical protein [Candidatus Micrarchaeota archaeon]MBD3417380.1 hypothetical protein [Candidatus Micrarchaeota archaeon]
MKNRVLRSPPGKNSPEPDFSEQSNFRHKSGKPFISEKLALSIRSRIAHLENRLAGNASRFREEAKGFIDALLKSSRNVSIGCQNPNLSKDFTVSPYIIVETSDPEPSKKKLIEALSEIWAGFAKKDLEFLRKMEVKFSQGIPVSSEEQKRLLMIKECGKFSRYYDRIR